VSALFAILSALLYALSNVLTRFALRYASVNGGVLISLLSCFLFVALYAFVSTSFHQYKDWGVLFFLLAGIVGPFLGRIFLYVAIEKVGTAISSTLYEIKPLFSTIAALLFLGEMLSVPLFLAIFLMMVGTIVISLEGSTRQIGRGWTTKDLLLPIASGACYGIAHALRKGGLDVVPFPVVGVMVQNIGALIFVPILLVRNTKRQVDLNTTKEGWILFALVGLLQVSAQWCLFKALETGTVVVVSPLSSLSTLFVLVLTALFLKRLEKITPRIVLGATFIVFATLVLTFKR